MTEIAQSLGSKATFSGTFIRKEEYFRANMLKTSFYLKGRPFLTSSL